MVQPEVSYRSWDETLTELDKPATPISTRYFEVVPDEYRHYPGEEIKLPTRGSKKSAGYDIYVPEGFTINPGETYKIYTDIRVAMQDDEFFWITPRSSTGDLRIKIAQTAGIVDADYHGNPKTGGNLKLVLNNYGNRSVTVNKGDRVVQGIFMKYLLVDGDDFTSGKERTGGFGHTGA
jgi:dUTP pyrophosphatase